MNSEYFLITPYFYSYTGFGEVQVSTTRKIGETLSDFYTRHLNSIIDMNPKYSVELVDHICHGLSIDANMEDSPLSKNPRPGDVMEHKANGARGVFLEKDKKGRYTLEESPDAKITNQNPLCWRKV